jgi:hypothetical protein
MASRSLVKLVDALAGKLAEYEPEMPACAAEPWFTGQPPASRMLQGASMSINRSAALPLRPKRKAPGRSHESAIERYAREWRNPSMRSLDEKNALFSP